MMVGGIMHGTMSTIRVHHGVRTLHYVTIAGLVLGLDVTSVVVLHAVAEVVLRRSLQKYHLKVETNKLKSSYVWLDGDGLHCDGGGVNGRGGVHHRSGVHQRGGVHHGSGGDGQRGGVESGSGVNRAEGQTRVRAGDAVRRHDGGGVGGEHGSGDFGDGGAGVADVLREGGVRSGVAVLTQGLGASHQHSDTQNLEKG